VAGFEEGWRAFETIESVGVVVKYLGFGGVRCTSLRWRRGFSTERAHVFTGVRRRLASVGMTGLLLSDRNWATYREVLGMASESRFLASLGMTRFCLSLFLDEEGRRCRALRRCV
jgi:hypothetical protein